MNKKEEKGEAMTNESTKLTLEEYIDLYIESMCCQLNISTFGWTPISHWAPNFKECCWDEQVIADGVQEIIKKADKMVALTSPSKYVREYRKWYEENKI